MQGYQLKPSASGDSSVVKRETGTINVFREHLSEVRFLFSALNTNMIYTVYLWHGIYYQTKLQPGDTLKRIEYKDRYGTTHIWVKN